MNTKDHAKMLRAQRAKQFMPFAALRGYEMLLNEESVLKINRKELTNERETQISNVLKGLRKGDRVKIVYYEVSKYISLEGTVKEVDPVFQWLCIVNNFAEIREDRQINFSDIWHIQNLEI